MKNIAIPIAQLKAKQTRDIERKRLMEIDVIPESKRQQKIDDINEKIQKVIDAAKSKRAKVSAVKKTSPEQKREQLDNIDKAEDESLWPLYEKLNDAKQILSKEAKAARLADLDRQDRDFSSAYGLQSHSPEEKSQRQQDNIGHKTFLEEEHYKHQRAAEYPSIADQLDAMWKELSLQSGLHTETEKMLEKITEVKAKYPKPDKNNG